MIHSIESFTEQYIIINQIQCSSFFVVFSCTPQIERKSGFQTTDYLSIGWKKLYMLGVSSPTHCVWLRLRRDPETWNRGKGIDEYISRTCLFPLLGLSTLQKKALSNQNKGHLGSRYICLLMICCCPLQYLMVIPCSPYPSDDAQWLKFNVPSNLTGYPLLVQSYMSQGLKSLY